MAEGEISIGSFAKGLLKKGKSAIAKAAKKPVKKGLAQVPSGISKGFARYVGFTFGKANNESKTPYVTLRLIGLAPNKAKGCSVTRTHYLEENDYATLDEIYERFFNDVKILGVDCSSGDLGEILTDLKKLSKDENIIVTFSTQLGKKPKNGGDPRVNVYLNDLATEEEIEELDLDSEPDTDDDEEAEEAPKSSRKRTAKPADDEDEEEAEDDEEENEDEEEEEADDEEEEDEEEEEKPRSRRGPPKPSGKKPASKKSTSKKAVKEEEEEPEEVDDEEGNDQPNVNDVFEIKIGKKKVEVEVVKVNTKAETVNVKELESGKSHTNIPWDALL